MTKRLDLHGVKHEDVDRVVENFVLMNNPPMRIITGNSEKMTLMTLDVLNRHDFLWERWANSYVIVL
jgi:hypothetical protein